MNTNDNLTILFIAQPNQAPCSWCAGEPLNEEHESGTLCAECKQKLLAQAQEELARIQEERKAA